MVKGEKSFFLQPGEQLESGIEDIYILGDDEGIVLRALVEYEDTQGGAQGAPAIPRKPGDTWMLKGPMEYMPTVEVEVVTTRKSIPLHENEGIYVRNTKSGSVRAVIGHSYMLKVCYGSPINMKIKLHFMGFTFVELYIFVTYRKMKNCGQSNYRIW